MPSSRFALSLTISLFALFTFGAGTALAAPPANDNFAFPSVIDSGVNNGDIVQLSLITDATLQVAAGEPEPTTAPTYQHSVWHNWTAPTSGTVSIDTCGTPGTETVLSFYTGTAINALTKVVADSNFGCGSLNGGARINAPIVAGTLYRIRLAGFNIAATGTVNMKVRTTPYIFAAPTLTGTATAGEDLTTNGGVWRGAMPQTKAYTWLSCADTTLGSCTPISTFAEGSYALQAADVGTYLRVSMEAENAVGSSPGASVSGPVGPIQPAPPSNDNLANAIDLGNSADAFRNDTNAGATFEPGEPMPIDDANSINSVWYQWTAPASGPAVFSTCQTGVPFDTVMAIYTGSGAGFGSLSRIGNDDDGCGFTPRLSTLRMKVTAGTTYWIQLAKYSPTALGVPGEFNLTIALAAANDDFADAIDMGNAAGATASSTNYNATREASEPNPTSSDNIHTVWFKWTAPSSGSAKFDTCSSAPGLDGQAGHDGVMAVYTQPGSGLGSLLQLGNNDDGCDGIGSMPTMTITVVAGTTYWIQVGKRNSSFGFGPPGPITLKVGTKPVNVTPPQISGNLKVGQTITANQGVWAGFEPIDFSSTGLWFRCVDIISSCNPIPGATEESYTLTDADLGKLLLYSEFPSNALGNTEAAASSGLVGPVAAALAPPPPDGGSVTDPVSIKVPTAKASKLKVKIKKGKFTLPKTTVTCASSATGACTGTATISVKVKKKTIKFKVVKLSFARNTSGPVKIVLAKSDMKKLAPLKSVVATVKLSISAPGGKTKDAVVRFTASPV